MYACSDLIPAFTASPRLARWAALGQLVMVSWDVVPSRPTLPFWDHRMTLSHSMLALTGLDVMAAMIDIDEFVSGLRGHV